MAVLHALALINYEVEVLLHGIFDKFLLPRDSELLGANGEVTFLNYWLWF